MVKWFLETGILRKLDFSPVVMKIGSETGILRKLDFSPVVMKIGSETGISHRECKSTRFQS
ncbi:hypothetical protein CJ669_03135 [Aliarcobacter cryaerophilus]|uniref:Uncharacterized protein n=1 Tax=Aliarcobacter cryaerophilus TaxID=28198 RepID=A0A2S9SQ49_9BACT|nr:hypothetical protein CJ669_03135 [Aliarcobacter cryaerophilus]